VTLTDEDLKRMGRGERWGMPADGHDYIAQMATELLTARAALAVAVEALRGLASEARGCDNPDFEEDDENGATEVQCSCCAVVSQTARNTLAKLDALGYGAAQGKADAAESGTEGEP
jgi:hypothetical protein